MPRGCWLDWTHAHATGRCCSADERAVRLVPCETAPVFNERFETAVRRVLAGDDSVVAANELERVLSEEYPDDERLDDLLEVLALYAPGQPPPYTGPDELRRAVSEALAALAD